MKIIPTRLTSERQRSLSSRPALISTAVILGAASILGATILTESAQAINIGKYQLNSHPNGGVAPPIYGLRLDGLINKNKVYTFDFKDVYLNYNGSEINISGSVFGGQDKGNQYAKRKSGFWDIDFTYGTVSKIGNRVVADDGIGSIKSDKFGVFDLVSFKGTHANSFQLKTGHRGVPGYSGFGWLNHAPQPGTKGGGSLNQHIYSSDWLFTAEPVPEPTTILATLLAAGGAQVMNRKRKRLAMKAAKQS